jgi:hypothetical protein
MYGDAGWLSDCEDSGWSDRFVARHCGKLLVGCAGRGAGARGADCGPLCSRRGPNGPREHYIACLLLPTLAIITEETPRPVR